MRVIVGNFSVNVFFVYSFSARREKVTSGIKWLSWCHIPHLLHLAMVALLQYFDAVIDIFLVESTFGTTKGCFTASRRSDNLPTWQAQYYKGPAVILFRSYSTKRLILYLCSRFFLGFSFLDIHSPFNSYRCD